MNLADALALNGRLRPNRLAVLDRAREWRYAEFDAAVQNLADGLSGLGIRPGDIVAAGFGDNAEHLVALYAIARLGGTALPMDFRWTAPETARVLAAFGARAALLEKETWRELAKLPKLVRRLEGRVVLREADDGGGATDFETVMAQGRAAPAARGKSPDMTGRPLLIALTSGTTGRPKGAVLTHGQMYARFVAQWAHLSFNGEDRYLSATPIYHGAGRGFCMSHLFAGGQVVLGSYPFDALKVLQDIANHRITTTFLVPTLLQRILDEPGLESFDRSSLRVVLSSGAALSPALRADVLRRFTPNLYDYYGSTDGGGVSVLCPRDQQSHGDSVGRAMLNLEIRVLGADGGAVEPGTEGEVCYRGPGVAGGYFKNPAATAQTFRDGWFHSGDLGRLDHDGLLYVTGRIKDIIIRGGVNIYPAEVESILAGHPRVIEAALLGEPSREFGEEAVAFIVLRNRVSAEQLGTFCRERLAPYKVPARFVSVAELPRNVGGKVIREELPKLPPLPF
ncbi:MAG: AMP-binding protein [bacterium]